MVLAEAEVGVGVKVALGRLRQVGIKNEVRVRGMGSTKYF
jgi:hypothetical protein